jgi:hypothetical protein
MDSNIHSTLPVTRILSSIPIELADAASVLSAYTEESRSNPSLHPDCELTVHGPKFPQEGGQGTSVVELLRRISRGMAGEQLGSADAILKQIRDRHFELGLRDDYVETLKHPANEVIVIDEPQNPQPEPVLEVVEEEPTKPSKSTDRQKSKDPKKPTSKSYKKSRERSAAGPDAQDKSKTKRKRKRKQDDE